MLRVSRLVGRSALLGQQVVSSLGRCVAPVAPSASWALTSKRSKQSINEIHGYQDVSSSTVKRSSSLGAGSTSRSPPCASVVGVALDHHGGMLQVSWEGGETEVYPYVWLRDNCLCHACFHAASHSRVTLMAELNVQACPRTTTVECGGEQVGVVWSDGHVSQYPAEWLHPRGFSETSRLARSNRYRLQRRFWGSELMEDLPEASFQELLSDDAALLAWLRQLEVLGFVMVRRAPVETGQVRRLAERVGFIRKTHYGEDFTVKAKPDPSNVAYLSGPLQLHADLPYYEYKPGVQFIHCIVQYEGIGGESHVADAVHVAHQLQESSPEHYHALTHAPVGWCDVGTDEMGEFHKVLRLPVICTDHSGQIRRINMSQPQRDSYFSIPAADVAPWYAALVAYYRSLSDPRYCLQFKMTPGDIMTFDNLRIVHGRTGYQSGHGERHVEGCYIDWDEVRSRRRVLENKLTPEAC